MDGAHDMGGAKGFGPVMPEPNEPVFHEDWERRAFALTVAMARPGGWNIDMSRFARENRPPEDYLSKSYFQIWLAGLETLMIERGLVSREEIEAGKVLVPAKAGVNTLAAQDVVPTIRRGASTERAATTPALFAIGESADEGFSSADAYASAAICPWAYRHHRTESRLPRLRRSQFARTGAQEPAMALHRPLRRAGIVGQRRRSHAQHFCRCVGIYLERI